MALNTFSPASTTPFTMSSSGLASRRGGNAIKPLSVEALKSPSAETKENAIPTPRTARGHLLAGLRSVPKTAAASSFATSGSNTSPTSNARNNAFAYASQETALNNGPKTALPGYGPSQSQGLSSLMGYGQQQQQQQPRYASEQILAPPEIHIDDQTDEGQMDPAVYATLLQQNLQLAQQQQMLQQQLFKLTQARQQLEAMNLNGQQSYQSMYQQQLLQQQQAALAAQVAQAQQPTIYTYIDPTTGQQAFYIDQSGLLGNQYLDQNQLNGVYQQQQQSNNNPRLEVSPPRESSRPSFRNGTPPRRNESPMIENPEPLPPPSANAFRRGHKKSSSLMLNGLNAANLSAASQDPPKSAGPRTANFPLTPLAGGYGPGQARAGEHPIRQPRGPPSIEELRAKPTSKHEGSKNFASRTRRSALDNLKRAGVERRKFTGTSSNGSISPISETAEEAQGLLTDNESESGRSGSGSLNGEDVEPSVPSSRTSTGSWGAIGSDRPSSRQKARQSADSVSSGSGDEAASNGSFASVFKRHGRNGGQSPVGPDSPGHRKAPMMVLSSIEKRKTNLVYS